MTRFDDYAVRSERHCSVFAASAIIHVMSFALLVAMCCVSMAQSPAVKSVHYFANTTATAPLTPPNRTLPFSFTSIQKGVSIPYFDRGRFIQFINATTQGDTPNVFLYGPSGKRTNEATISVANASSLRLVWVSLDGAGKLAASGRASLIDGTMFNFITVADLDGKHPQVFGTGDYLATQICSSPDGSLWTIGTFPQDRIVGSASSYDTLRRYSTNGDLMAHFLPRSDLFRGFSNASRISSGIFLRSTDQGVVLYDGVDHLFYTYDLSTQQLEHWAAAAWSLKLETGVDLHPDGFGVCSNGQIYASFGSGDPTIGGSGLFNLSIKQGNEFADWQAVPGTVTKADAQKPAGTGNSFFHLLGCDGNDLVYRQQMTNDGSRLVSWSSR